MFIGKERSPREGLSLNGIRGNRSALAVFVFSAFYFILLTILSSIRYLDFYTLNGDLGINMQELWSNTHGYLLFETSDYKYTGAMSHLEIHSSYIALPISYLYAIIPGPMTLFIIQAAVVSLSVVALYFLAVEVTGSERVSAAISIVYGLNASLISAVMFDFHWLSFIPLGTFLFFYLILKGRYGYSAAMIIIGSMTQEIFPFIAASILLFQFFNTREGISLTSGWFRKNRGFAYICLGILSVATYVILMEVQVNLIPVIIGNTSAIPALKGKVLHLWDLGRFPVQMSLSAAEFWFLSYLLFMFLPVFKPKHILMVAAWMYESIAVVPFYGTLGNQYDFITVSLMAPSAIFGLKELISRPFSGKIETRIKYMIAAAGLVIIALVADGFGIHLPDSSQIVLAVIGVILGAMAFAYVIKKSKTWSSGTRLSVSRILLILFISIILMNVIISPLNPSNEGQSGMSGYEINYTIPPQSHYMSLIESYVPPGSTIVTSDNLFTLIADNVHAYSLRNIFSQPGQPPYFPYNASNLPEFLLLSSSQSMFYTPWINSSISTGIYGLVLEIKGYQYPGNIFLFRLNYTGMTEIINAG